MGKAWREGAAAKKQYLDDDEPIYKYNSIYNYRVYGNGSIDALVGLILTQYVFKLIIALVVTPFVTCL